MASEVKKLLTDIDVKRWAVAVDRVLPNAYRVLQEDIKAGNITEEEFTKQVNVVLNLVRNHFITNLVPQGRGVCMLDTVLTGICASIMEQANTRLAEIEAMGSGSSATH